LNTLKRNTILFLSFITILLLIIAFSKGITLAEALMYAIAIVLGILLIVTLHDVEDQRF